MKEHVDIGILYSRSGTYAALSQASYRGAVAGVEAVNADASTAVRFKVIARDPAGDVNLYAPMCAEILAQSSARHIIGCVTSSSRKDVIPILDRTNAMLWYNCPYEGFETSNRVIYSHACANQHLLPLLSWCFVHAGLDAYLVGSNYIWGWETCRVARTRTEETGGKVLGERFVPLGDENIDALIADIETMRPRFILNSLVGASSYAFLRAYHALGLRDDYFTSAHCAVVSCNLTECEISHLGAAAEGLISVGPDFETDQAAIVQRSSLETTSYRAVLTLAKMLHAQDATPFDRFIASDGARFGIEPDTHHRSLDVKVAQIINGRFRVLDQWIAVAPDPYLTRPARHPSVERPHLRVVNT